MTYIFTAAQFAGFTKKTLGSDDLLVLENVSFLAELLYQDVKKDIKEVSSQPWPEYLIDAKFKAYDYGVQEDSIRENLEELPQDFTLSTITFEQIIIIGQLVKSLYEQVDDRTVFEVVDNVLEREEWFEANQTESKEINITVKQKGILLWQHYQNNTNKRKKKNLKKHFLRAKYQGYGIWWGDVRGIFDELATEVVKIPLFAEDVIKVGKAANLSLFWAMDGNGKTKSFCDWIEKPENQETFARAWNEGYKVKEENSNPLFEVEEVK